MERTTERRKHGLLFSGAQAVVPVQSGVIADSVVLLQNRIVAAASPNMCNFCNHTTKSTSSHYKKKQEFCSFILNVHRNCSTMNFYKHILQLAQKEILVQNDYRKRNVFGIKAASFGWLLPAAFTTETEKIRRFQGDWNSFISPSL